MKEKIILAYSGGLDTSVILHWLIAQGYDVVCFIADIGQQEDFALAQDKAYALGACAVYIEDLKQEFLEKYVFESLKANAVYEGKYLLGTALSRPLIAQKQVEIARREGTTLLAHGATGKGNDQVRFEITYACLMPNSVIIAPWKDPLFIQQFKGRPDLIDYAQKHDIPVTSTHEKPYSMDANLMHTSYEGGKLEDPAYTPDESMFIMTKNPSDTTHPADMVTIEFKEGIPVSVVNTATGTTITDPLQLFLYLNELGGKHGIGRVDIVENRFVGLKSRGVYETPGGTILWSAHRDLEGLILDREVAHLKDMMAPKIAQLIYNGFWFSPEMEFLMAAINQSQKQITGTVFLKLYRGNAIITGRTSPMARYKHELSSMDVLGAYNPCDAQGFINLAALRLKQ